MGHIALLLVIIMSAIAVTACVFLPGQNAASDLTPQQKDASRQILIKDNFTSNLSGVGDPESFGKGHELFDANRTLALVPVTLNSSQNVSKVYLVDLDRNKTIGQFTFAEKNLTYDHAKALINITVDAPIVKDSFWDKDLMFITVGYSGFMDMAPEYSNWSGRFITAGISMDDPYHKSLDFHKFDIIIDDTVPRIIGVSDWFAGVTYQYSPEYVLLPPGQEKRIDIINFPFIANFTEYKYWTHITLEPQDAKVYPLIFEGNYNTIKSNISANALVYKDFMTGEIKRYDGSQAVGSGWSANVSLDDYAWIVHLILKSTETDRDIQARVDIVPNREMMEAMENKSRNI